ncbi:MAG: hypothetical protein HOO93_17290 [Methyloglobulus sp.]|nr:hypothetical protein [Methyloglobulus sp.]
MHKEAAKKYIDVLLDNVFHIFSQQFGVNHAEHVFIEIVKIIQDHPSLKAHLLTLIENTLNVDDVYLYYLKERPKNFVTGELIEYLAHAFRWTELLDLAQKRKIRRFGQDADPERSSDIADGIIEALSDDWADKDFYRSFSELDH